MWFFKNHFWQGDWRCTSWKQRSTSCDHCRAPQNWLQRKRHRIDCRGCATIFRRLHPHPRSPPNRATVWGTYCRTSKKNQQEVSYICNPDQSSNWIWATKQNTFAAARTDDNTMKSNTSYRRRCGLSRTVYLIRTTHPAASLRTQVAQSTKKSQSPKTTLRRHWEEIQIQNDDDARDLRYPSFRSWSTQREHRPSNASSVHSGRIRLPNDNIHGWRGLRFSLTTLSEESMKACVSVGSDLSCVPQMLWRVLRLRVKILIWVLTTMVCLLYDVSELRTQAANVECVKLEWCCKKKMLCLRWVVRRARVVKWEKLWKRPEKSYGANEIWRRKRGNWQTKCEAWWELWWWRSVMTFWERESDDGCERLR